MDSGISLHHYNEMLRHESAMDELRAIALYIAHAPPDQLIFGHASSRDYLFTVIQYYCRGYAEDIYARGRITPEKQDHLHSGLFTIKQALKITDEDIAHAGENQLYKNSGFWEMRKFLGQFVDIAEEIAADPVDVIVCAGISGCVVGEYLGLVLEKRFNLPVPVEHMVFTRADKHPVQGILPSSFNPALSRVLLVEDAVVESRTTRVMVETLSACLASPVFRLFALEIERNQLDKDLLRGMEAIYTFEEF
jgi:adenine/guanine phosphoribosyltransferase-like PRPP-binding protein